MAKAEKSPKPEPKLSKKAQYERFVETARKLGADESVEAFDEAFKKAVPAKHSLASPRAKGR